MDYEQQPITDVDVRTTYDTFLAADQSETSSKLLDSHNLDRQYRERNRSLIGCKYDNSLLAVGYFSGSWGHARNFIFFSLVPAIFTDSRYYRRTLNLPPRVSAITGVDCMCKLNVIVQERL